MPELQNVELKQLQESTTNPRRNFDKKTMAELVASVKESGIVTPLLVRTLNGSGSYEIVAGARRFRAAKEVGLTTVPVIVRQLADEEALELQIIENDQRSDVHPLEQCAGYQQLQKTGNFTIEQLAKHVGKSPSYVARRLKYADLIEPIRKLFLENKIGSTHAFLAARLTPEQQKEVIPWLKRGDSVEGFTREIERHFFLILKEAVFDTTDATLVPKAGSCIECPKRTGFNKALFEDVKNADTCTDPACFETKVTAFTKRLFTMHKDAVHLSVASAYGGDPKPKYLTDWVKAGDKNCADTKEGIVVERTDNYGIPAFRDAKLGQLLKVCTNPKCKTHRAVVREAASESDWSKKQRESAKKRKVELRRRGLMFKELAAEPFKIDASDHKDVLVWRIRELSHDHAKAVCDAMGWLVDRNKSNHRDEIAKRLSKLDEKGVQQWIYLLTLAEAELWFYSGSDNKGKLLDAKAKEAGCQFTIAAVEKLAKEKKAAKKTIKTKKEKAA